LNNIANELKTRIDYWNSRRADDEHQIANIILCGGSVNMKGLPGFLEESFGVATERADVWQNAFSVNNKTPEITKRYSYGYATAIGLALTPFM
jgi:Tfp pilus assembly PilM family ATPase